MLDKYTKDMLFENILNVYSDKEQLEIIKYLTEQLKSCQDIYMEENSIEEVYSNGLEKILNDIKDLEQCEKEYFEIEVI